MGEECQKLDGSTGGSGILCAREAFAQAFFSVLYDTHT